MKTLLNIPKPPINIPNKGYCYISRNLWRDLTRALVLKIINQKKGNQ